jgi:hypothetical protein
MAMGRPTKRVYSFFPEVVFRWGFRRGPPFKAIKWRSNQLGRRIT